MSERERYAPAMVAHTYNLFIALLVTLCLGTATHADEAQDALVEQGVQAYDDGDYLRAKGILLPLAKAGHPKAMHYIGRMYDGTDAFPFNPKIECDWYEKAANAGYPAAMYNMSICYDGDGRPDDPEMDKSWLLKAAEQGHIPAMMNLSALDATKGEEYLKWHRKAIEHGSTFAKVSLWLDGLKDEVPNLTVREIICVSWYIIILDGDFRACD